MIANIKGTLIQKSVNSVVIDVHGVGYRVFVPLSTFYDLPDVGTPVSLKIHTHVKEDAIQLFGFRTSEEKDIFQLMISVSGIGPRLATNILSGISAPELARAVCAEDLKKLVGIPGIGRKTAERMIFELKEKLQKILLEEEKPISGAAEDTGEKVKEDALSALVNLGYRSGVARNAVEKVIEESDGHPVLENVLKKALKMLSR